MHKRCLWTLVLLCLVLLLLPPPLARATLVIPYLWEQMVLDADFVGVAECVAAGGIVARYTVLDSLKGMPAGTEFNLRQEPNYWGDPFPITGWASGI